MTSKTMRKPGRLQKGVVWMGCAGAEDWGLLFVMLRNFPGRT